MGKVSWLHVSDIHIVRPTSTPGAEAFNQEQALNRFVDFLKNSFPHDQMTMPTYLLIAGDLAFRGQKDDYQNSRKFSVMKMVDAVAGAMAIRPKDYSDRVFPVPGNHDIDRTGLKDPDLERANLATGADEDKLNDLFLNKDKEKRRAGILARSRAYCGRGGTLVCEIHPDPGPDRASLLGGHELCLALSLLLGDSYGRNGAGEGAGTNEPFDSL
jgi:hypothetical protein